MLLPIPYATGQQAVGLPLLLALLATPPSAASLKCEVGACCIPPSYRRTFGRPSRSAKAAPHLQLSPHAGHSIPIASRPGLVHRAVTSPEKNGKIGGIVTVMLLPSYLLLAVDDGGHLKNIVDNLISAGLSWLATTLVFKIRLKKLKDSADRQTAQLAAIVKSQAERLEARDAD